eukprot:Phypoly_transcript_03510.p1 GENE.Phypoly_transcript_03510~~Phypoly_transcript_03510.p1  ORF type:complete len:721 (+),score=115.57 Phypoly_transcript_03510:117-2279(+)
MIRKLVVLLLVAGLAAGYVVERNVMNYGAKGDGKNDDTEAIITALTQGRADNPNDVYPNAVYSSSTQHPAYVFFPPGIYLVTQTLPVVYYTQMVGDPSNPPTIKFVSDQGVRVLEVAGSWYNGVNQDNFYRQIRNFVIDMTQCDKCTGVHWQVAQATSITNVYFKSLPGSGTQGMWMENGSGGFFSDLVFEGGVYGIWVGNQQFTSRNITVRDVSSAAIYLNWDWVWNFKGLHVQNAPVGVDINTGTGTTVIVDSDFTGTPIAVRTKFTGATGDNSVLLDNVQYNGNGVIVQDNGNNVLSASSSTTVKSWVQGRIWQNDASHIATQDLSSLTPARTPALLGPDGAYFEMTRPNFVGQQQIDVTTLGLVGDGNTDNSKVLQAALNTYAGKAVLFFPHGIYVIENTVVVPPGSRLVGQVWSVLAASGSTFQDANAPVPMLQVGNPGQTGVAQLVDFMFSTKGPVPGAILLVWNLHDPPNAPGSNGVWDVHYRIGGAIGTDMESNTCPEGDGSNAPASACSGAFLALHIASTSSLYLENVWVWTADHDIDGGANVNIYNARGVLVESQGPTWFYGTASEHHLYYQYNFNGAKTSYIGAIQTESAYFQPSGNTPFRPGVDRADPSYCTNDPRCNIGYALVIKNSTDISIYGMGFYSWFNVWGQSCLPQSCQIDLIQIENSKAIHAYAINTYGSVYSLTSNQSYSAATANPYAFCAGAIVDLNFF